MSTAIPKSGCARCGYVMDEAIHLEDDNGTPKPGDLSICVKCAHVAKYGDSLALTELTQEEVVELSLDSDFVEHHKRIQWAIRQVWSQEEGKAL